MTRLSPTLAAEIRAARAATPRPSYRALGERFGISASHAQKICDGALWRAPGSVADARAKVEQAIEELVAAVAAEARNGRESGGEGG